MVRGRAYDGLEHDGGRIRTSRKGGRERAVEATHEVGSGDGDILEGRSVAQAFLEAERPLQPIGADGGQRLRGVRMDRRTPLPCRAPVMSEERPREAAAVDRDS